MEILQTIWTALTTENLILVKITTSFLMFIELGISMLLFTTILKIYGTRKQKILYVSLLSLIGIFSMWIIPAPYYTFINIIACPILVFFIFKTSLLKSILSEVIPYVFFVILSSLLITLCVKVTNLPSDYFVQIPLYKLCFSSVMYLIASIFYLICNKCNINITLLDKMKKGNNRIIFANFIIRNYYYSSSSIYICCIYK